METFALLLQGMVTSFEPLNLGLLIFGYLGIYFSLIFFLAFYLRYFSEKSVAFITIFAITTPILTFLFFEWLLKIPLPQGISEPLFYPVYDVMYGLSLIHI